MRKTLSLIIVVLLTLQISLYGLDSFEEPTQDKLIQSDDSEVQFAGRQSSGIHGNSSSNTTDCGFQGSADGLGGHRHGHVGPRSPRLADRRGRWRLTWTALRLGAVPLHSVGPEAT